MSPCSCCGRQVASDKLVLVKLKGRRGKWFFCPECAEYRADPDNPQNRINLMKNKVRGRLDELLKWVDSILDEVSDIEIPASAVKEMIEDIHVTADEAVKTIQVRTACHP